jgi:NH3-dependent NAD+ synthetase
MFDAAEFVEEQVSEIKERIDGKAMIACSGGVDSTVAAVIASQAIGDRLLTVYVDTGLMRKGETETVAEIFESLGVNYRIIDASDEFFAALRGVTEPSAPLRTTVRSTSSRGPSRPIGSRAATSSGTPSSHTITWAASPRTWNWNWWSLSGTCTRMR